VKPETPRALPTAQRQNGITDCIINHPKHLMALFKRGQGNIAARFSPAQPYLKHFTNFHVIQRQAHENESHRAGFSGDINMTIGRHEGEHALVVFLLRCSSSGCNERNERTTLPAYQQYLLLFQKSLLSVGWISPVQKVKNKQRASSVQIVLRPDKGRDFQ
jgi:hypothetical protein